MGDGVPITRWQCLSTCLRLQDLFVHACRVLNKISVIKVKKCSPAACMAPCEFFGTWENVPACHQLARRAVAGCGAVLCCWASCLEKGEEKKKQPKQSK